MIRLGAVSKPTRVAGSNRRDVPEVQNSGPTLRYRRWHPRPYGVLKPLLGSLCVLICMSGCGSQDSEQPQTRKPAASSDEARETTTTPAATSQLKPATPVKQQEHSGLHNVFHVSGRIYSGGEPLGEEGFRSLRKLGVKTVVSVDGARPNVALARSHGLNYVHIPIGYDGFSGEAGDLLARLVREVDGPIYIHCHHGRHRGPAAAAVACIAAGEFDNRQAFEFLKCAGTSQDYTGLWRDVEAYQPPPPGKKLPELVEIAEIGSLAAAMADIDRKNDNLKLCREANWGVPAEHPDLVAVQEALLLREGLHEAARNLADEFDEPFKADLAAAERLALTVEESLKAGNTAGAEKQFDRMQHACKQCHVQHRN